MWHWGASKVTEMCLPRYTDVPRNLQWGTAYVALGCLSSYTDVPLKLHCSPKLHWCASQVTPGCLPSYAGVPPKLHWVPTKLHWCSFHPTPPHCVPAPFDHLTRFSEISKFSVGIWFYMGWNSSHIEKNPKFSSEKLIYSLVHRFISLIKFLHSLKVANVVKKSLLIVTSSGAWPDDY